MTWLSEIEQNNKESREEMEAIFEVPLVETPQERMARVIRELVRFIRVLRATDDQKEIAIAHDSICSPDAKEILNDSKAKSST